MFEMHDWTLLSIQYEWKVAQVVLTFQSADGQKVLMAYGVRDLHIPQKSEWGPSVSVNEVIGPLEASDGLLSVRIEMQSGDTISIIAAAFA